MTDPESLRILALQQVWKHRNKKPGVSTEFLYRSKMREYSKTFSTPLHVVEDLPIEDVLLACWEDEYESMSLEDLEEIRDEAIKTQAQRAKEKEQKQRQVDAGKAALERQQAREAQAKSDPKAVQTVVKKATDIIHLLEKMSERPPESPDQSMKGLAELPGEIEFKFSDDWDDDDLLGGGDPTKRSSE
jgi:hypothetical protein